MQNKEFGNLLSKCIKVISALEDSTVEGVHQDLGEKLGVSPHTIGRWRKGHVPGLDIVWKLAEVGFNRAQLQSWWVRRFLASAQYPNAVELAETFTGRHGYVCEFLDDRVIAPAEIFIRVQNLVLQAQERVWVLNSHPKEPTIDEALRKIEVGTLDNRVDGLERLVASHAYYEQLIGRAASKPGAFEYVRIVQVPVVAGEQPTISPKNSGYNYLYHYYRMLKKAQGSPAHRPIKLYLYAGTLLRNTTFIIVDNHTLIMQITGINWEPSSMPSYEMRGALIIRSEADNNIITQFAKLFDHIREGTREGQIVKLTATQLEQYKGEIPPLEEVILKPLDNLLSNLWRAERFDGFIKVCQALYQSGLSELRELLIAVIRKYKKHSEWSFVYNAIPVGDEEFRGIMRSPQETISTFALKPQAYGLVVGINGYQHLPQLKWAAQDATDVRHQLVSGGYNPAHVFLLLDDVATYSAISDALDKISRRVEKDDSVFIFFSGHGAQRFGLDLGVYLCPVEADPQNLRLTAISSNDFTKALNGIRKKVNRIMVCLDTCHSGAIGRLKDASGEIRLTLPASAIKEWVGEGRLILASSGTDEASWEYSDIENGLFTHHLVKGIKSDVPLRDNGVWALDLANYVLREVAKHGVQRPYLQFKGQDFPVVWPKRG